MKFSSPCGNVTPGLERNRDGENSSFVTHGTFPLPHSWLSSCDKIKIPHSRLRRLWGIFISSRLLSHSWGSGNVPFVTHEEFSFPIFVAAPLIWEKPIPISLQTGSSSFPHWRGTLTSKIAMREIPDPKSTMGEWYNIKSFPVFKKTGKLFPCFFCYIGTFLYYEGNYFPVFEGKSLPVFLLYRNISLL